MASENALHTHTVLSTYCSVHKLGQYNALSLRSRTAWYCLRDNPTMYEYMQYTAKKELVCSVHYCHSARGHTPDNL